ncbi:hypothetical protein GN958_ATG00836 [Phytophthora infestans]|uniref:Secreted RxLR effector peptide protein n=1 Tax=Phytophthora infestans TaxID=4787 RepID=A0A8S9VCF8_PHYIN|nr:hypothetical protein GN958_ATG00836 [Phytophthora infestans]
MATKITDGASKLAKQISNAKKYETRVASTLKFESVGDALTSTNLERLAAEGHYGYEALAKALLTAESRAKSTPITVLRNEQMTRWLTGGKTGDDIVKLLKISDDHMMLTGKKNQILDDYIKAGGEEKMWTLLQAAKTDPRAKDKAKQMETSLMEKWVDEGQLPANVFQWLQLHKTNSGFNSNNLNKFADYVDVFNQKNSGHPNSVLSIYKNAYGDALLAENLMAAMSKTSARDIAKKLQEEQVVTWSKSSKSADDVINLLKIGTTDAEAITRRNLAALQKFNQLKGGDDDLIKALTKHFPSKDNLATILEKATQPTHRTTLQKKQFDTFMGDNIRPENFLSSVFRTVDGSVTDVQKRSVP